MTAPQVHLSLDGDRAAYLPGDVLSGAWSIDSTALAEIKAIELSVMWHTEGKGDEDLAVHHFERVTAEDALSRSAEQPRSFSVSLPNSPLSYDGLVVKICWCVRVRAFLHRGRELVIDLPFQLGHVPAQRAPLPAVSQDANGQDSGKPHSSGHSVADFPI